MGPQVDGLMYAARELGLGELHELLVDVLSWLAMPGDQRDWMKLNGFDSRFYGLKMNQDAMEVYCKAGPRPFQKWFELVGGKAHVDGVHVYYLAVAKFLLLDPNTDILSSEPWNKERSKIFDDPEVVVAKKLSAYELAKKCIPSDIHIALVTAFSKIQDPEGSKVRFVKKIHALSNGKNGSTRFVAQTTKNVVIVETDEDCVCIYQRNLPWSRLFKWALVEAGFALRLSSVQAVTNARWVRGEAKSGKLLAKAQINPKWRKMFFEFKIPEGLMLSDGGVEAHSGIRNGDLIALEISSEQIGWQYKMWNSNLTIRADSHTVTIEHKELGRCETFSMDQLDELRNSLLQKHGSAQS